MRWLEFPGWPTLTLTMTLTLALILGHDADQLCTRGLGSNVWWSFIARYISDFIRVCTRSLNFIIIIFGFTYLIRIFPGLHPKSKKINYSVSFLLNYKFEDMRFLLRVLCSPSSVASSTMKAFSSSVAIATLRVSMSVNLLAHTAQWRDTSARDSASDVHRKTNLMTRHSRSG